MTWEQGGIHQLAWGKNYHLSKPYEGPLFASFVVPPKGKIRRIDLWEHPQRAPYLFKRGKNGRLSVSIKDELLNAFDIFPVSGTWRKVDVFYWKEKPEPPEMSLKIVTLFRIENDFKVLKGRLAECKYLPHFTKLNEDLSAFELSLINIDEEALEQAGKKGFPGIADRIRNIIDVEIDQMRRKIYKISFKHYANGG
jgi:hypothetical protein